MSIVVGQSLPYTTSQLKLGDAKRWSRLFTLMRPSIRAVETDSGQAVVVDTALAKSSNVLIATIGNVGSFSCKILSESHVAAFTSQPFGGASIYAEDIGKVLKDGGFQTDNGIVVVRVSSHQGLKRGQLVSEISVDGELTVDHILSILASTNSETKSSFKALQQLLEHFVKSTARTTSMVHHIKSANGLSVVHTFETAEFASAKRGICKDLSHLLTSIPATTGDVVYSVHYSDINGLSRLENNILAHEISDYFAQNKLLSHISHSSIIDNECHSRGWAISLCPVPTTFLDPQRQSENTLANSIGQTPIPQGRQGSSKIQFSDPQVRKIITEGCNKVIKAEPTITEYDTIVGDGDCGYTLRDGAKQVLSFISKADLSQLPSALSELVDDLEVNMGGTSGALYCIFLSSLAQNLWDAPTFVNALQDSLDSLLKYTRARLGDRTCLDCLIPFVEELKASGDADQALAEAEKGVESTKNLEAKLGRSSYLDEAATRGVPDPGAFGLLMLLQGMVGASALSGEDEK